MATVLDDTVAILQAMGLVAETATMEKGYFGVAVKLPEDAQAYFVWSAMNEGDFHFRLARFCEGDEVHSHFIAENLPLAIEKTRSMVDNAKYA